MRLVILLVALCCVWLLADRAGVQAACVPGPDPPDDGSAWVVSSARVCTDIFLGNPGNWYLAADVQFVDSILVWSSDADILIGRDDGGVAAAAQVSFVNTTVSGAGGTQHVTITLDENALSPSGFAASAGSRFEHMRRGVFSEAVGAAVALDDVSFYNIGNEDGFFPAAVRLAGSTKNHVVRNIHARGIPMDFLAIADSDGTDVSDLDIDDIMGTAILVHNSANVTVSDVLAYGLPMEAYGSTGLEASTCDNCRFFNLRLYDFKASLICDKCTNTQMYDSLFEVTLTRGAEEDNDGEVQFVESRFIQISNSTFRNMLYDGLEVYDGQDFRIADCHFEDVLGDGMLCLSIRRDQEDLNNPPSYRFEVTGNSFGEGCDNGLWDMNEATVTDNTFWRNYDLNQLERFLNFDGTANGGLTVKRSDSISVSGNTFGCESDLAVDQETTKFIQEDNTFDPDGLCPCTIETPAGAPGPGIGLCFDGSLLGALAGVLVVFLGGCIGLVCCCKAKLCAAKGVKGFV